MLSRLENACLHREAVTRESNSPPRTGLCFVRAKPRLTDLSHFFDFVMRTATGIWLCVN